MKPHKHHLLKCLHLFLSSLLLHISGITHSQSAQQQTIEFEDYVSELVQSEDEYLSMVEEWRELIDHWLEDPLHINSEEADLLLDARLISRYQLNKLKEYRLKYGDMLSVYELVFVDGWDSQTTARVMPLVSVIYREKPGHKKTRRMPVRQQLVVKTAFTPEKKSGYLEKTDANGDIKAPDYIGSPLRLSLRYDIDYRKKYQAGIRMEKDPGEPYLVTSQYGLLQGIKTPDHISGFVQVNRLGPVRQLILGDYRVSFGFGINLAAGQYGALSGSGPVSLAHRIRPNTSLGESGFMRGIALNCKLSRFTLTLFGSSLRLDGTSPVIDTASGKVISFSSLDQSGMHRTNTQLDRRKAIRGDMLGGHLVYGNNWLKAGVIAHYKQFDAEVRKSARPSSKYYFGGRSNLVAGMATAIWLNKWQWFSEFSMSRNKGWAFLSGLNFTPVTGANISLVYRNFDIKYQNWHGMGFISQSRNNNEKGLRAKLRLGLPHRWNIEALADISESPWIRYNLDLPTSQFMAMGTVDKNWRSQGMLTLSFKYLRKTVEMPDVFTMIARAGYSEQFRIRMEGRYETIPGVAMKTRIESNMVWVPGKNYRPAWLLFQDIAFKLPHKAYRIWLRVCYFEVSSYDTRMYAYENDVLYDFTSYMYYGKGMRGILMLSWSPLAWIDTWVRFSTVFYSDRKAGSGSEQIDGNRMNELEFQVRIKIPG
jgi:hypothetical protein